MNNFVSLRTTISSFGPPRVWNGLKRRWNCSVASIIPDTSSASIWTLWQWSRSTPLNTALSKYVKDLSTLKVSRMSHHLVQSKFGISANNVESLIGCNVPWPFWMLIYHICTVQRSFKPIANYFLSGETSRRHMGQVSAVLHQVQHDHVRRPSSELSDESPERP